MSSMEPPAHDRLVPFFSLLQYIYAQLFTDKWNVGTVDKAVWIGTSGLDGQRFGFDVLPEVLPFEVDRPQLSDSFFTFKE